MAIISAFIFPKHMHIDPYAAVDYDVGLALILFKKNSSPVSRRGSISYIFSIISQPQTGSRSLSSKLHEVL